MKTIESKNMKELYKSPSVKLIVTSPESMLCQSGTERYRLNDDPDSPLNDDDFE